MNPLNALTTPNETTILLLGGVALLLINIFYGFVRTARGHLKAGWFTVGLVLVACALIGVGSVQSALASSALGASRGGFNGTRPAATAPARGASTDNATAAPDATAARTRGSFGGARLTATAAAAGGASPDSVTPAPTATAPAADVATAVPGVAMDTTGFRWPQMKS
jgi:hypothetical protein